MALHFFLMQMPKFSTVGSDEDEEADIDPGRLISKLKHKIKHKAKTVHREKVLKSKVDKLKKRFDQDKREEEAMAKQHVDPVRLLTDPQGFGERLLAKLAKTTERFEVRILMMSVLARVINEHDLVLLGVYPLFERYFEPTQLHATNILALASTCVHRMIPPEPVESMVRTLADRFVNDRSDRDSITIGINTIREMCKRQPMAMNADLLADLITYRQRRGERGVIMAARALLQLYREVNPELLPAKLRGTTAGPSQGAKALRFGAEPPLSEIPGLEALFKSEGDQDNDVANSDDLDDDDDSSSNLHITTDSDDDSAEGEWQLVTDDSDDEAAFGDTDDDVADEDDEVPQLVPIRPSTKKGAAPPRAASTSASDDDADNEDSEEDYDDDDDEEEEDDEDDDMDEEEVEEAAPSKKARPTRSRDLYKADANGFVAADDLWEDDGEAEDVRAPPKKQNRAETRSQATSSKRFPQPPPSSDSDDDGEEAADDDEEVEDSEGNEEDYEEDDDDDDDEDEDESSGSGEWVDVSHSDDNDEADEEEEADATAAPAPTFETPDPPLWYEASTKRVGSHAGTTPATASTAGKGSVASTRVFTDAEFAQLRALQLGIAPRTGKKQSEKAIEKKERMSRKDELIRGVGERGKLLDASAIETFTTKKRDRDREKKIDEAREKRIANNPFEARKKRKTKLTTTHREKQKAGKLYQMTKRSRRVAEKIKRSVQDRQEHSKDMKKKSIKFRIARGWKA